jgi:hypothetical protein
MTHAFPPPEHVELEPTDAEEAQDWFDEWFGHWLSDQSDDGYEIALAEVERRELQLRGSLPDSHSTRNDKAMEAVL